MFTGVKVNLALRIVFGIQYIYIYVDDDGILEHCNACRYISFDDVYCNTSLDMMNVSEGTAWTDSRLDRGYVTRA